MTISKERSFDARKIRIMARSGEWKKPTAGVAKGYVQTNVAILPKSIAFEFMLFCQRNPKPCPIIEVMEPGQTEAHISSPGSDLRTDVPRYRVYQDGELVSEPSSLLTDWREDLVTFLLGCSFTFEHALIRNGIRMPHFERLGNVSMFITNISLVPAGRFSGQMVVTQRWIPRRQLVRAVQITSRFPSVHGAPIHIGDPEAIGIKDPMNPDFGDPWEPIEKDSVPVYWACGVTPQAVAMASKPELMITHSPGHMFVTDLKDEDMAIS